MKELILQWLRDQQWTVRDGEPAEGAAWALVAENRAQVEVHVRERTAPSDELVIFTVVVPDQDVRERMDGLSDDDRAALFWDVRLQLLQMGVSFEGLSNSPERVGIRASIFGDGLTKDAFFQRLHHVNRATLALRWNIMRACGEPAPPESRRPSDPGPAVSVRWWWYL
jgi:hypothetical protein